MKLLFAGDVMLGRLVNSMLRKAPPEYPWSDTLPIFKKADARICNLECVISDRGVPWSATPKVFHFRSDAKHIDVLKAAKIDAVSIANNHSLDFEYEAMADMVKILDKNGIRHAGAGENIAAASRPAIFKAGGVTIALIAFTDNEPTWEATDEYPGVFYVPVDPSDERAERLFEIIRETRKEADVVIVSAHWGPNWGYTPLQSHVRFGHLIIDNGADIVFGHSCHVFQGIEIYNGRPILYSAGDFIDDYAVDEIERNDESFIFMVEFHEGTITRLYLYPTMIDNFQARLAGPSESERISAKMLSLCSEFKTPARWAEDEGCLEITVS